MSDCARRDLAELLHAYELGLLPEDKRTEVELHLLDCEQCFHAAQRSLEASRLLKFDAATRQQVRALRSEPAEATSPVARPRIARRWLAPSLVTAAIVFLLILKDWRGDIQPEEPAVAAENRVAILPFQNLAQPDDSGRYGDIVAGLVVTDLSESPLLSIVSSQYIADLLARERSLKPGTGKSAIEIAKNANARWMLTGAITQVFPELNIHAELVEVATGTVKIAIREEGKGDSSLFATADRLAGKIKQALIQPALISKERDRAIVDITTESPEAYQEYIRGLDLWQRMYVDDAEPHFRKAIALDSTFAMPYYYLSMLVSGPQRAELVRLAQQHIVKAGTRDGYLIRSRAAFIEGNQENGIRILTEFVTRFPDEKQPLLQLARVEHAVGRYDAALTHLQTAVFLDSSYKEAYNQLAYTYDRMGDFENAIRAIDRYVALAPNDANPYDSRAQLYALNGKLDKAIESYRQALAIKPDFLSSLNYLGIMYLFKHDYSRAESCFVAVAANPASYARASSRLYLSYLPAYQGKFREALARVRQYKDQDSLEQEVNRANLKLYLQAIYLEACGRLPEAITAMEDCIKASEPEIADSNRKQAYLVHLLAGNRQLARARQLTTDLRRVLDSNSSSLVSYWDAMGAMALAEGRPDSSVFWYAKAAGSSDQFYEWLRVGISYLRAERFADAVSTLEKLQGRYTSWRMFWSPESVKLHYYLGMAYEASNWSDKAVQQYQVFLDIWKNADPGIAEVMDARNRLAKLKANT